MLKLKEQFYIRAGSRRRICSLFTQPSTYQHFLRGDDIDLLVTAKTSHKENIFSLKPAKRKTAEELYSERLHRVLIIKKLLQGTFYFFMSSAVVIPHLPFLTKRNKSSLVFWLQITHCLRK